jgi:hypothetical protein
MFFTVRREFLTGFSKRKKAKQTEKRNKAIARDKEEMRTMRKQVRSSYPFLPLSALRGGSGSVEK